MSLHYDMTNKFTDVIRAAIAIQVVTLELADEDVKDDIALPALEKCVARLAAAVKELKRSLK